MKLILVSNTSLSIRNFRIGLMEAFKARGVEVVFCCSDNGYAKELAKRGFVFLPLALDRKGVNFLTDLRLIFRLFKLYKKEKPDIILHFTIKPNIYGAIAAKFSGIPCINSVTGLGYVFIRKTALLRHLVKILYRISCAFSRYTFFQNKDDLDFFLSHRLINKKKAVLVNGSGVNLRFYNSDFCQQIENNKGTFIFLYTGRFLWDKGVGEFVEAARIVKQKYAKARFWLVGIIDPGNPSEISQEILDQWVSEGIISYWKEPSDVRPFICQSDCVVLPSYREGIPRSLLEAMAMEKPIITTDVVGCRDVVVEGVNGFSVTACDYHALSGAFCRMIELSSDARLEMGRAGCRIAKDKFDEDSVNHGYIRQIQKIQANEL